MSRALPCGVPSCPRLRRRFGRNCTVHARRLASYGSPLGRPMPMSKLKPYALCFLQLFRANPDHPGLLLASTELQSLLNDSLRRVTDGETVTADVRHLARLASHDVTAEFVLAMTAAVSILDQENPGMFPDANAVRFAVARAVCSLASRLSGTNRQPLGSRALSDIGSILVDRYSPFVAAVLAHYAALQRAKEKRTEILRWPFGERDTVTSFATLNNERTP